MEKQLETKNAGCYAFAAARNAEQLNNANKALYDALQLKQARTIMDLLDSAYNYKAMYVNYRKKFIAIKMDAARAKDAFTREVEKLLASKGYTKVVTEQGIVIRIPNCK